MEIKREELGDVTVGAVRGRLDAAGAPALEVFCREWIDGGTRKLLLDLSGLEYVSSAGLRAILATAKKLQGLGGSLAICGLGGVVKEVFTISGFDSLLPIAEDRSKAVELL